jgi:thiol-disulfide isomerase/thioredoxin
MKRILAGMMLVGVWSFATGCGGDDPGGGAGPGAGGAASGGASGSSGQPGAVTCVGVKPAAEAWQAQPSVEGTPPSGECPSGPTCEGAPWPRWRLADVQPQSCGYQATYGLDGFEGRPTVVVLLAGWCGFCQAQAVALQKMQLELEAEGKQIHFAVVNASNAEQNQKELTDRCTFPIFQDTAEINAWGLHGGGKDDFYLYDSKGALRAFLPPDGATPTNLSTPVGYEALKAAIVALP